MRRGIGRLRAGGSVNEAAAWAAAVTANGGTYSAGTLTAVTTFVASAKASGYWGKLNRINLFCGDQLAAALVPLKIGGGSTTDTNVNFVAGDYTEATGLTGNGSTKYLKTGLIPSVSLTLNDTHLSVYNRAAVSGAGGDAEIGVLSGATNLQMNAPFTDNALYSNQYNTAITSAAIGAVARGMIVASRISSTDHQIYRNASSVASEAVTSGTLPTVECFVYARNDGAGNPNVFASAPLGSYSIGSGLTAANVTAYNTHMQAFQLALSRNV